jgi:hypothetical protein
VIATGEDVDSVPEQLLGKLRRNSESARGIFAIGDGQVDFFRRDNLFQVPRDKIPPGRCKNVTNKKQGCQGECLLSAQDAVRCAQSRKSQRTGVSPLCAVKKSIGAHHQAVLAPVI